MVKIYRGEGGGLLKVPGGELMKVRDEGCCCDIECDCCVEMTAEDIDGGVPIHDIGPIYMDNDLMETDYCLNRAFYVAFNIENNTGGGWSFAVDGETTLSFEKGQYEYVSATPPPDSVVDTFVGPETVTTLTWEQDYDAGEIVQFQVYLKIIACPSPESHIDINVEQGGFGGRWTAEEKVCSA